MLDYVIAIPSYGRAKELNAKTLLTLRRLGIPHHKIHIFVVAEQHLDYILTINPNLYGKFVVGVKGIIPQRRFIETYFPEGTRIISLDDDIESLDLSLTEFETADQFFTHAFDVCIRENAYIWGVYPVFNPFFRQPRKPIQLGLTFIIGAFYGFINRPNDSDLLTTIDHHGNKEDVERSIRYWLKDSTVVRFNHIGFKTKTFSAGGLGKMENRLDASNTTAISINNAFPDITSIKTRKTGMHEIVLKESKISRRTIKKLSQINVFA